MKHVIIFLGIATMLVACQTNCNQPMISDTTIQTSIAAIAEAYPDADYALIARGVEIGRAHV